MGAGRIKNATRNVFFSLVSKIVAILLPFLTRTLILYFLGEHYLGIGTLFSSILGFLSLAELGIGSAIVYAMYRPIADNDSETICALLNFYKRVYRIIGTIVLVVGVAILPLLPYLIKGDVPTDANIYILYVIYLVNSVISYFFAGYKQGLLFGFQRNDIKEKIATIINIVIQLFQAGVIILSKNFYLYAMVPITGTIATNIITAVTTNKLYPELKCKGKISKESQKAIMKRLSGLIGTKLNGVVIHSSDVIVISAYLGLSAAAKYGNYYYILNAICGFIIVIFSALTASVGDKIARDDVKSVKQLFSNISFINLWMVGWCSICLLCLYQPFMELWVGLEMMFDFKFVVLIVLYFYIYQIQRTMVLFKDAGGFWYEDRFRPYVAMTVNVVLNFVLIHFIGIYGVVLSSIVAFFIGIPWDYISKYLFNEKPWKELGRMLLDFLMVICVGGITYLCVIFIPNGYLWFMVKTCICCIVPNLMFLLIFRKRKGFIFLLQLAKNFKLKVQKGGSVEE